jgi:ABC-type polysaccharide/polyol phosphate transport system ATPase subunit
MIKVENLSKKFKIYSNPWLRGVEWASFGKKKLHQEFWALRDVSFEVSREECLGIIGPNGSGKSTLLKILSRALYPTSGTFEIRGRVLSLLELGTGFNVELTGRQNLYNSVHLLGLPREYLEDRIGDIEAFAGLGDFFDRPVKLYSSGMYVRLAFSLFAFMRPEVLMIDETLSVGDIFFQQKSFAKMREIISGGTTCLFVSHDTAAIENLCERVLYLQQGEVAFYGSATEGVNRYLADMGTRRKDADLFGVQWPVSRGAGGMACAEADIFARTIITDATPRHGTGGIELVAARVVDRLGRDTFQTELMQELDFYLLIRARENVYAPSAGIYIYDRLGTLLFQCGVRQLQKSLPDLAASQTVMVRFRLGLTINPGTYTFNLSCTGFSHDRNAEENYVWTMYEQLGPLVVTFTDTERMIPFGGLAKMPLTVDYRLSEEPGRTETDVPK